jgi:hypothetical protein
MPLFQSGIFFEPRSVKKANSYQYQFNAGQTNASWSFTQALNGEVNFKENPASGTPGGSTLLTPTIYDCLQFGITRSCLKITTSMFQQKLILLMV